MQVLSYYKNLANSLTAIQVKQKYEQSGAESNTHTHFKNPTWSGLKAREVVEIGQFDRAQHSETGLGDAPSQLQIVFADKFARKFLIC